MESLFLNSVTYENEMLDAYMRKLTTAPEEGARPGAGRQVPLRTAAAVLAGARPAGRRPRAAPAPAAARGRRASPSSPSSFDFGNGAAREKTLHKEFTIRNLGDADLVIENVSTTCGCTVAGYDDRRW